LGSFERFIGILIEHYEGAFPFWLAPEQVAILNITDRQDDYCQKLSEKLQDMGYRVHIDLRNEKIGFKIREHTLNKIPYLLVIGDKEVENKTVAIRTRTGEDLGVMTLEELEVVFQKEMAKKGRITTE
jgi:threonyl-tRNA synthetase